MPNHYSLIAFTDREGLHAAIPLNNKVNREIYLTFDDGIEAGTEEVIDLLNRKGVRGTFFLIGKRIESAYKRDKEMCLRVLKKIYENHAIGNHSYSHTNEHYSAYYNKGGVKIGGTDTNPIRRSVKDDFAKAKDTILFYLAIANGKNNPPTSFSEKYPAAKNQTKGLIRFPGTNTWYIKDKNIYTIKCINRDRAWYNLNPWSCTEDTKEEALELGKHYNIFGWDCEWKMNAPHAVDLIRKKINEKEQTKTIDYLNIDDIDPYINLSDKKYIHYDRPEQSMENIKEELLDLVYKSPYNPFDNVAKTPEKVVLLMHEREFRKGILKGNTVDLNDTTHLDKLGKLIDYFKRIKAKFNTLDKY